MKKLEEKLIELGYKPIFEDKEIDYVTYIKPYEVDGFSQYIYVNCDITEIYSAGASDDYSDINIPYDDCRKNYLMQAHKKSIKDLAILKECEW